MSRGSGILITILNVIVWAYFHRHVVTLLPGHARWLRWLSPLAFILALHPALMLAVGGRPAMMFLRRHAPMWLSLPAMAAQFAAWLCLLGLLAIGAVHLFARAKTALRRRTAEAAQPLRADRRRLVAGAALIVPTSAINLSAGGVWASRQTPVVSRVQVPIRRDLTNLHGLTFAQVSDVHIGSYMDAARLDEISGVMNALAADFHVITGDLLDNHISQMELATRFIRALKPKRNDVFACMGNHEYIAARTSDVRQVMGGLRDAGAHVLLDDVQKVNVGADHLWMSGIDYPPRASRPSARTTQESLQHVLRAMTDDGAPRVLLSHHPRTFIEARELPFDIMLSGHTHGGQIKLGRIKDYALTPMLPVDFYHNGLYQHQGRRLYVNAGAGGWLPVRINCPPEITLVQLVPA
jgi:uncharacterized protein